jgi:hypothetical protein
MRIPNQNDELLRVELIGKTLDAVFDAISKPKPKRELCECDRDKRLECLCSLCAEGKRL